MTILSYSCHHHHPASEHSLQWDDEARGIHMNRKTLTGLLEMFLENICHGWAVGDRVESLKLLQDQLSDVNAHADVFLDHFHVRRIGHRRHLNHFLDDGTRQTERDYERQRRKET